MFGGSGSWWFKSESDSRWDCNGRSAFMAVTAGMPREAKKKLEELKEKYGDPPEDLEFGCMKD